MGYSPWGCRVGHDWATSVQFSCSVVSDSLQPHESRHARPSCPSPTHGDYSNSSQSSGWCHPAISSSVVPFSSCPQSLPALGSFPITQLFAWGGQSTGVSASTSVLPMETQDWSLSLSSSIFSWFSFVWECLYMPLFYEDILARYSICSWQYFSSNTWKMMYHFLQISMFSYKKSIVIQYGCSL